MEWRNIIWVIWSILVASPGFIALFLQWRDGKDRIKASNPYAELSISSEGYPDEWLKCELFIYNKWAEPVILTKLTAPEGIELTTAIARNSPYGGYDPDLDGALQSLELVFTAPASKVEGTRAQSPPFVFFMRSSTDFSSRKNVLFVLERTSIRMSLVSYSMRRRSLPIINTTAK